MIAFSIYTHCYHPQELIELSTVEEKGAQNIIMSWEYKAMFEEWKNHTNDFQNLLLDYENVDDKMKPWSEIYHRANALFKEKVWYQRPRANQLDKANVDEENYKNAVFALRKEYNFDLETHDDYNEKFKTWLKAYLFYIREGKGEEGRVALPYNRPPPPPRR